MGSEEEGGTEEEEEGRVVEGTEGGEDEEGLASREEGGRFLSEASPSGLFLASLRERG